MNSLDVFSMCARNLLKRKLRTFLSILGVVIGTASIVVMVSLGMAVNKRFADTMENMGDLSIISVYNSYEYDQEGTGKKRPTPTLDDNAVAKFSRLPGAQAAAAFQESLLYVKAGHYVMPVSVIGIEPDVMGIFYSASEGRLLKAGDKNNLVFGAYAEYMFYKENNPKGYSDRYYYYGMEEKPETVVDIVNAAMNISLDYGLIYPRDAGSSAQPAKPVGSICVGLLSQTNDSTDYSVFMDASALRKLLAEQRRRQQAEMAAAGEGPRPAEDRPQTVGYESVKVKCKNTEIVKSVCDAINGMGFQAYYPAGYLDNLQSMASGMQAMLGAIGAVSLLVAAIGIANTMVMSIYERTREIGVMKVIGASLADIRKLFLLEATAIGFAGGVLGVLLSLLISHVLNSSNLSFFTVITSQLGDEGGGVISLITPGLCVAAASFAAIVGLVSGYFPAQRAMRVSAVAALNNV